MARVASRENSLLSRETAGNSASFGHNEHRKGLGIEGLAVKFPARASREFFAPEQGICREFFARAGNSRGDAESADRNESRCAWLSSDAPPGHAKIAWLERD